MQTIFKDPFFDRPQISMFRFGVYMVCFSTSYNYINQAMPQKQQKTFIFLEQKSHQLTYIDHAVCLPLSLSHFNLLLAQHCPLADRNVAVYDHKTSSFALVQSLVDQNGLLAAHLLEAETILVRFEEMGSTVPGQPRRKTSNYLDQFGKGQEKDQEGRAKTIGEVMELVRRWRQLHLHKHSSSQKKATLVAAAKNVGISKKILDQYYCWLRLGELHHFDFSLHADEPLTVLKQYIRNQQPAGDRSRTRKPLKYSARPQRLKMFKKKVQEKSRPFIEDLQNQDNNRQVSLDQNKVEDQQISSSEVDITLLCPQVDLAPVLTQIKQIQKEFFTKLENCGHENIDPYTQKPQAEASEKDSEDYILFD